MLDKIEVDGLVIHAKLVKYTNRDEYFIYYSEDDEYICSITKGTLSFVFETFIPTHIMQSIMEILPICQKELNN